MIKIVFLNSHSRRFLYCDVIRMLGTIFQKLYYIGPRQPVYIVSFELIQNFLISFKWARLVKTAQINFCHIEVRFLSVGFKQQKFYYHAQFLSLYHSVSILLRVWEAPSNKQAMISLQAMAELQKLLCLSYG